MILGLSLKSVWMALFCRFQCHVVSARVCLCVSYLVIFYCQFIYCYLLESSVLSALNRMAFSNEKNLNGSFDGMHHTTRTHTHTHASCVSIKLRIMCLLCGTIFVLISRRRKNTHNTSNLK